MRIIESAAKRLGLPMERFVVNLEEYGNTSAASVPIALCEAIEAGTIRPGDQLVMVGFGAGLTWAAAAVKWRRSPEEVYVSRQRRWWLGLYSGPICARASAGGWAAWPSGSSVPSRGATTAEGCPTGRVNAARWG